MKSICRLLTLELWKFAGDVRVKVACRYGETQGLLEVGLILGKPRISGMQKA